MNKVQTLRLLVSRPQLTRLTTCQFCLSNHRENNATHKSVFERYVDFQRENKIPLDYEGYKEEVKVESSDKVDGLGQSRPIETNKSNKSDHYRYAEDETSKTFKSEVEPNSNQDTGKTLLDRDTTTLNSNVIQNKKERIIKRQLIKINTSTQEAIPHLKYILDCELIPDVKSDLKKEDYLLFHEHLEKTQINRLPKATNIVRRIETDNNKLLDMHKESKICMLGEDNYLNYLKAKRDLDRDFHKTIHRYLSGEKSVEISPDIQGYWNSVKHILDSLDEDDVKMLGGMVSHPLLHYVGGFDCIAVNRNTLCTVVWKAGRKPKPTLSSTLNYPIIAASILGAINASFEPNLVNLGPVTNAVIVVAYNSGQPAHVHYLNDRMVEKYWNQWLISLYSYWSHVGRRRIQLK